MTLKSGIQVSYNLAREDKNLTTATITRVFENGCKVLCHLSGEDAETFIDAWNMRKNEENTPEMDAESIAYRQACERAT
jgi:hypothetical protein